MNLLILYVRLCIFGNICTSFGSQLFVRLAAALVRFTKQNGRKSVNVKIGGRNQNSFRENGFVSDEHLPEEFSGAHYTGRRRKIEKQKDVIFLDTPLFGLENIGDLLVSTLLHRTHMRPLPKRSSHFNNVSV